MSETVSGGSLEGVGFDKIGYSSDHFCEDKRKSEIL